MEYVVLDNNIIVEHCCSSTLPEDTTNIVVVPSNFIGYVGMDIRMLTPDYTAVRPMKDLISEGIVVVPDGFKVQNEEIVRMSQEELNEKYKPKIVGIVGSNETISIQYTFDPDGNPGYHGLDSLVNQKSSTKYVVMNEEAPSRDHIAKEDGTWELSEELKYENEKKDAVKQIKELQNELKKYDYIGVKIATGRANKEEYTEQISQMNILAEQIDSICTKYSLDPNNLD